MTERERDPLDNAEPVEGGDDSITDTGWEAESATRAEAAQAVAQAEDRLLRLAAEYDNYRKRTTREKVEAYDRGAAALVTRILDVLDDFDRLANATPAAVSDDGFRDGFELVRRKLAKELESAGLERLDPVGQVFDPTTQDAVSAVAPETPDQDHTVKATFQVGYRFKGSVIRPARVQVYSSGGAH